MVLAFLFNIKGLFMDSKKIAEVGFKVYNEIAINVENLILTCELSQYKSQKLYQLRSLLYELAMDFFNNSNLSKDWLQEK